MDLEFDGEIVYWRGPAPWFFVPLPEPDAERVRAAASALTYGWGCIPATASTGDTSWTTSLFPKDGGYLLPVKAVVRRAEGLDVGSTVSVRVSLGR